MGNIYQKEKRIEARFILWRNGSKKSNGSRQKVMNLVKSLVGLIEKKIYQNFRNDDLDQNLI